jgi:hypothetical protein
VLDLEDSNKLGGNLIFVGGSARSGTTLVQNMLDSHPAILGAPEFLHLPEIIKVRKNMQRNVAKGWIDQICSQEDIDNQFRTLILNFLIPFAERHNAGILSEKTPENILVFPELVDIMPEAKYILVVRDPRAIVASMLQVGHRARKKGVRLQEFTRSTNAATKYIRQCYDAGFKASLNAPNSFLTVLYEDVVRNPDSETKKMCDFLGIEWNANMCSPGEKKHMGEEAITVKSGELWYSVDQYNSNPHVQGLDKWKNSLTKVQQIFISKAFSDYKHLSNLGYTFSLDEVPALTRLLGELLWISGKVHNKISRVLQRYICS